VNTSTSFLYDGLNVIQELTAGAPTANLLTGRLDEVFVRTDAGGSGGFLVDALGSTLEIAEASAILQTHYMYEPFGASTTTGSESTNPQEFTGRDHDLADLYFYRARFYSSGQHRFLSEDPLGFRAGPNGYVYVDNAPLMFRDPLGLQAAGVREVARDIWNVRPLDAVTASNLANQSLADAVSSGLPGIHNGAADAFRHCLWSCRMTQALGADQAKLIADEHENAGEREGQPANERLMDEANNNAGRECGAGKGSSAKDCCDRCMDRLFNGQLFGLGGKPLPIPHVPRPHR
jgi:RHS repeat-associated protein